MASFVQLLVVWVLIVPCVSSLRGLKQNEGYKCVEKGVAVAPYDNDDTVVCDRETGYYDMDKLDPDEPPRRCDAWNPKSQSELGTLHPLAICIYWNELYGRKKNNDDDEVDEDIDDEEDYDDDSMPTPTPTTSIGWEPKPQDLSPQGEENSTTDTTNDELDPNKALDLPEFALRLVVPYRQERSSAVPEVERVPIPFSQTEFIEITQRHLSAYLEEALKQPVVYVELFTIGDVILQSEDPSSSRVAVTEPLSGKIYVDADEDLPSEDTVQTLCLQALEGQALWEYFFLLRDADDEVLGMTLQVILVNSGSDAGVSTTGSGSNGNTTSTMWSAGIILALVAIGCVTAAIVVYMILWTKRQQQLDDEKKRGDADTPETQASSQFFPESTNSDMGSMYTTTPTSIYGFTSDGNGVGNQQNNTTADVSEMSTSIMSGSALHSIREHSVEESDDDGEFEQPSRDVFWGDETNDSSIDVHSNLLINTPSCLAPPSMIEDDMDNDDEDEKNIENMVCLMDDDSSSNSLSSFLKDARIEKILPMELSQVSRQTVDEERDAPPNE